MTLFKRNLLIGYGLSLLLLIVSAVASYISISNLLYNQQAVTHTHGIINKLENTLSVLKDAETGQRGFLLTGNDAFLEPYNGAQERAASLLSDIRQATADNPSQQVDCDLLRQVITKRLVILNQLIDQKRKGETVTDASLIAGKVYMDSARNIVKKMVNREQASLEARTARLNQFTSSTPIFIVVASLLAILVTVISFLRVNTDFEKRAQLQKELQQKNHEVSERIHIIENITAKIAAGNFSTRVTETEKENLGVLATSLDKMAESLDYSFTNLADKEWQQTGIAELNEMMIGEKNLEALTSRVLQYLVNYTRSAVGVFYLATDDLTLQVSSSVNLNRTLARTEIQFGEGLAGQSALTHKQVLLQPVDEAELVVDFSAGSLKPKAIIAVPVMYETRFKGIIELASLHDYSSVAQEFLRTAVFNIGMAIHSARDHQRLQEFLHETQTQSEELQAQHSELENINAELEAQAEKLQSSEEELRVQQEELQQANAELEERSRLLEEKNETILERNLAIQKKAEELALSTKYKSEFLANMSHELRTPLNSILLLSRLLSENHAQNLSADQIEYANVIQSSGKGLLTLIDEILDLSKIESGKMELEIGDVRLENLTSELEVLFAPLAKDKGIGFVVQVDGEVPAVLETDHLRVEQILRNLVSNALKFTKKGSVTVTVSKHDNDLAFAVKDTGIGIAKEKQQTIFEAFQQADGSTRREFGGTGLGLSISRELAKLLGGEIKLQSEEGKGSEFTLLLPLQKEVLPATTETMFVKEEEGHAFFADKKYVTDLIPASVPDDRKNIVANDKIILIIEDDTGFAKSLLDYTRSQGYKGIVAVRGDEGIELAKQFRPLGILLDVQLPVKSGWDVMEELKSNKTTRPIPVHMMSSHEVKTKSLSKGAVDFISKPVAFEKLGEMFQKIEQALSKHPKKVLIVEENPKHAQALAYFLESYHVNAEIKNSVDEGVQALKSNDVDCVILDMGIPAQRSYDVLEDVKKTPGLEQLPIIVFTGKNLSHVEEMKIKQYADSIVVKTAHSYQRILDEVSLFLHLMEENNKEPRTAKYKKLGELGEVLKGKTVLVADDDVRNIFSITKSLENYGVNVVSAIDGKDALNQLQAHPKVDLVLMDMMMPEMDGYESTRKIRSLPKYRNLPVIAVTAKAMTGDREKCIAAGASDYITKPVDVDQLTSLLRVWLYQ
ncbi:response regulator [Flavisolibacter ginsenosidimutans]|uniref:histidine kinase n=1 Tax=Flavisolibacter ginsenosidimutans TaxID=661481 RepID=A0A5B8UG69_9BACT|nr:response regulator [Flavisolibacter ginsenosidimutans]QEC55647.1 response regulator [Flavisolibacter ginsenosidimutans]